MSGFRYFVWGALIVLSAWAGAQDRWPTNEEDAKSTLFVVEELTGKAFHVRGKTAKRIAPFRRGEKPVVVLDGEGFWLAPGAKAEVRWLLLAGPPGDLRDSDMVTGTYGEELATPGTRWVRNRRALRPEEMRVLRPILKLAQSSRATFPGVSIVHPEASSPVVDDDVPLIASGLRPGSAVVLRVTSPGLPPRLATFRADGDGFLQGERLRLGRGRARFELVSPPGAKGDRRAVEVVVIDGEAALRLRSAIGRLGTALLMPPSFDRTLLLARALADLERSPAYAIRQLSRRASLVPEDVEARGLLNYLRGQ